MCIAGWVALMELPVKCEEEIFWSLDFFTVNWFHKIYFGYVWKCCFLFAILKMFLLLNAPEFSEVGGHMCFMLAVHQYHQ